MDVKTGVSCLSLAGESPTELLFPEVLNSLQMDLTIPIVQFFFKTKAGIECISL